MASKDKHGEGLFKLNRLVSERTFLTYYNWEFGPYKIIMNTKINDVFQGIDGYRASTGPAAPPNRSSQGNFTFIDTLEKQVRNSNH